MILIFVPIKVKIFFPLCFFFRFFFLIFKFLTSEDDVSRWNIFWHLAGLFPEYPGSVIWCLTLICGNSNIVSNISSLLLSFFFPVFPLCVYYFLSLSHSPCIFDSFFLQFLRILLIYMSFLAQRLFPKLFSINK